MLTDFLKVQRMSNRQNTGASLTLIMGVVVGLLVLIGLFVFKTKFPILTALSIGIMSVFLIDRVYLNFPLIGIFLGFYLYLEYCRKPILLIPISFASAFLFLTKGDLGFGALSILVLSCIVLLTQKRIKEISVCSISYVTFLIMFWASFSYPLETLLDYLKNQL